MIRGICPSCHSYGGKPISKSGAVAPEPAPKADVEEHLCCVCPRFLLLPFGGFNAELEGWLIRGPLPLREGKFDA